MPSLAGHNKKHAAKHYDAGGAVSNVKHPNYGALGTGLVDDRAAFVTLEAATDVDQGLVPKGTYLVSSNLTLSKAWQFTKGAIIKPASGVTVTFAGGFNAPLSQCFDLSLGGLILFTERIECVYPQWWGAIGATGTNDYAALQAAIICAQDSRCKLVIPNPQSGDIYQTNTSLKITKAVRVEGNRIGVTIMGQGLLAGVPVLDVDGEVTPNLEYVSVQNLTLMTNDGVGDLLHVTSVAGGHFKNILLRDAENFIVYDGARTYSNRFDDIVCVNGAGTNALLASPNGGGHYFTNCSFAGEQGVNWRGHASRTADNVVFQNCNFEGCSVNDAIIQPLSDLAGISFIGCRFEEDVSGDALRIEPGTGKIVYGVVVTGCVFHTESNVWAITFNEVVRGYKVSGNYFNGFAQGAVRWNGTGSYGTVSGNICNGGPITDTYRNDSNAVYNNYRIGVGAEGPQLKLVPALIQTYAATNVTPDRAFDADTVLVAELADVVGTLIADLRAIGLIAT